MLGDLNGFPIVTDRLQQAHVNAQVLTRLFLTRMKDDAMLQTGGHAITDGSEIYYYGISDGGIQGGTFMGLSRDIVRGVLNVPGSEWSLMIYRSHDFAPLKTFLDAVYPDFLDQQVLIAALQSDWDYTDPISFAPHLINDPLPSTPAKQHPHAGVDSRRGGAEPGDARAGARRSASPAWTWSSRSTASTWRRRRSTRPTRSGT